MTTQSFCCQILIFFPHRMPGTVEVSLGTGRRLTAGSQWEWQNEKLEERKTLGLDNMAELLEWSYPRLLVVGANTLGELPVT